MASVKDYLTQLAKDAKVNYDVAERAWNSSRQEIKIDPSHPRFNYEIMNLTKKKLGLVESNISNVEKVLNELHF